MRRAWLFLLLIIVGFSSPARAEGVRLPPGARLIDLTHAFDDKTPYWPEKPPEHFVLTRSYCGKTPRGFFYCAGKMAAPEHGGTHLDAPLHFAEKHPSVEAIPLSRLMAPAVVIDMSAAARANRDARLSAGDVAAFEKEHGAIARGTIVLVRTGWAERYGDAKRYYGTEKLDDDSDLHFPGVGEDAARVFVQRGVGAVGIDGPSLDYGPSKDFATHQVLLGADIPQLENVAALAEVPATGALVIALPMKIAGGTGAPLRIVAVVAR
jgi:kynurenine formamidase